MEDTSGQVPVKKLSEMFDNCAKSESNSSMKVYLRIRPVTVKTGESTIAIESGKQQSI
jgi:hypothetical protein